MAGNRRAANAGKEAATKANAHGKIEAASFRVPRKTTKAKAHGTTEDASLRVPRKQTAFNSDGALNLTGRNTTVADGSQFGAHGAHRNKGKLQPKSPLGTNMSLSRRLSRKIIQGSPLRSPM